jgi:sodium/pantothenate symporter
MRSLELLKERPLVWSLFLLYLVGTSWLAWRGHKKTTDIKSFAIGRGDMHPVLVGVALAASIASTATFVINPGFVYVHGISALMHLGVAAGLGLITGLFTLSAGFRRIGVQTRAITLPHWMAERYRSRALGVLFASINLLSLSFVVLIVGGISIVMQQTLGLTNLESLVLVIAFVFSYVFVGGAYAHAYTNMMQGGIMVVIAAVIVASGFSLFSGGIGPFFGAISAQGPELTSLVNPKSALFGSFFSVYVSGFVIGFSLVCQPHILTKALYVKRDADVRRYLTVTVLTSLVFTALLLVGLYARVMRLPVEAFLDPVTGAFSQDRVMAVYLAKSFDPVLLAVITVALLAAGMSTLDGILVALSSIAANDLFTPLAERTWLRDASAERRSQFAHRASQLVLVALAVTAFVVALHPPRLLGIFGQLGVYGIVASSTVPIALGIVVPALGARAAGASALTGLGVHFGLYAWGAWGGAPAELGFANPGVTATWAIFASALVLVPALALVWGRRRQQPALLPAES